jgi:hypothetical protein
VVSFFKMSSNSTKFVTPAQFAEGKFELNGGPYNLDKFPYARVFLNDGARDQVLMFGRQTAKSTSIAAKIISILSLKPYTQCLHVSPTQINRDQFVKDRLEPFMKSAKWRGEYFEDGLTDNFGRKDFKNGSVIHIRNAYHDADRCRGISSGLLSLDEIQDISADSVSVIRECQTFPEFKMTLMAGTPKSMETSLQKYWEISDQKEFSLKCNGCGKWNDPLGERNIGLTGMICASCGKGIHLYTNPWAWIKGDASKVVSGYRFPQIAFPVLNWKDLLTKLQTASKATFMNEVLAQAYDGGDRPISRPELMACCTGPAKFLERGELGGWRTVAGIDWGQGMGSHTVIVVLRELPGRKMQLVYAHKFEGFEASDPNYQREEIEKVIRSYNCELIFADWGNGKTENKMLRGSLGAGKYFPCYLSGNFKDMMQWKPKDDMFVISREQSLTDVFVAIKSQDIVFPEWPVFEPFGQEILNVFTRYAEGRRIMVYDHHPDRPDDSFHAINFAMLAYGML